MQTKTIAKGARHVIATRNNEGAKWHARLYVNHGETATPVAGRFKTTKGLEIFAARVLA